MSQQNTVRVRRGSAVVAAAALAAGGLVIAPNAASAAPDGSGLVISEVYGGGGNSGAPLTHDFVELFNPTSDPIDLSDLSLEYKSAAGGSGGVVDLSGAVEPGGHFLVQLAAGNGAGDALPEADQTGSINMSGANGRVYLYEGSGQFDGVSGDVAGIEGLVDMVGYGTAASYEGSPAPGLGNQTSASRAADGADTDDNAADFSAGAPSPVNAAGETTAPEQPEEPEEPGEVVETTIADARGLSAGTRVEVPGVVTAVYPVGGFRGFTIQDPSGDPDDDVSDAIFVWGDQAVAAIGGDVEIGASVRVTGATDVYNGLAQLRFESVETTDDLGEVQPITDWAVVADEESREAHMSELVQPDAAFVVTDNYDANFYGSFLLAQGEEPLVQPTAVIDPHDADAIAERIAEDDARTITLDDGRSVNFNSQKGEPLSYLTPENRVRVGDAVSFERPFVLDWRFNGWSLQPTEPIEGAGAEHVTFETEDGVDVAPTVDGDISVAIFNVLNYFPTTAEEYVDADLGTCTFYTDRDGARITANRCDPNGPRGAADDESLARQEAKIVQAISELDASIVSLQEVENSIAFGKDRDLALETLVDALNAHEGAETWAYAESPLEVPADEDVIRNAFIYQQAEVETVGASHILLDHEAFENAREPLFQGFKPAGAADDEAFLVASNHLKSKGSGADDGTGQGNANPDRIRQAEALAAYTTEVQELTGIEPVLLTGDFNSYAMEDPAIAIEGAGFTNLNYALNGGEATYVFQGRSASLDHVFANEAALDLVTDVDVWQINAQEQIAYEYSRYNYNATLLFDETTPFRASDHNPIVVGLAAADEPGDDDEEPTEDAGETGAEDAGEEPTDDAGETGAEDAGEEPVEDAGENGGEDAGEAGAEDAGEEPADDASETGGEDATESGSEESAEAGSEDPAEDGAEDAADGSGAGESGDGSAEDAGGSADDPATDDDGSGDESAPLSPTGGGIAVTGIGALALLAILAGVALRRRAA